MRKLWFQVLLIVFLAACTQAIASTAPTTSDSPIALSATQTVAPISMLTPVGTPTATITPPGIESIALDPLALNETNVSTGMERLSIFGTGEPNALTWSPDGKLLAIATERGVWLYDGITLVETGFIDVDDSVSSLAFSPDGMILALAVEEDGQISLWDVRTGLRIKDLQTNMISVRMIAWGQTGQIAAFGVSKHIDLGNYACTVMLWDGISGNIILTEDDIVCTWEQGLDFSPDGKLLAYVGQKSITVVESSTGQKVAERDFDPIETRRYLPLELIFNLDGSKLFIMGGEEGNLIWDFFQDQSLPFIDCVSNLMRSSAEIGICRNGEVTVFDLANGYEIRKFVIQMGQGYLALSPDGKTLAYAAVDDVKVVNTQNGELIVTIPLTSISFSAMATAASNGIIKIDGQEKCLFAAANRAGQIQIWDIESGNIVRIFENGGAISSLVFSPDQATLFSITEDGALKLWNIQNGEITHTADTTQEPFQI